MGLNVMFGDVQSLVLIFAQHHEHLEVIQNRFFSPTLTDHSLKLGIDMKYNSPIKSFIVLLSIVLIMSMNFYIGDDETTHFKKKLELQWPKIQNY